MRRIFILVAACWAVLASPARAVDTDGDGLLDLIDAPGFDPLVHNFHGANFRSAGIQDLDGANLLTNTGQIRLFENLIESIEPGDFAGLSNVTLLELFQNRIMSVEPGDFNGLTNLEGLQLADNLITSIEPGDFDGPMNLQYLGLSGNQIASVEREDFEGLSSLKRLDIARNEITAIDGVFSDLHDLIELGVGGNRITALASGGFSGLGKLEQLHLESNEISVVDSGAFEGLGDLEFLDLNFNKLTELDAGAFNGLGALETLWLHFNRITGIEAGDFDGLDNIRWLHLKDNQVETVGPAAFRGLNNLTRIDMSRNRVRQISDGAFADQANLTTLVLSDNPLTELNLAGATLESLRPGGFSFLTGEPIGLHIDSDAMRTLFLDDAVLSQSAFNAILGELTGVTDVSLTGLTFSDENPIDLSNLMGIATLDHVTVDQALYSQYADDFVTFAALAGNSVTVVPEMPLAGDFDLSGGVDNSDLTLLLVNWAQPATPAPAGWTGLPQPTGPAIDNDELTALLGGWGQTAGGGSGSTVPEPATFVLLVVGASFVFFRHQERTRNRCIQ